MPTHYFTPSCAFIGFAGAVVEGCTHSVSACAPCRVTLNSSLEENCQKLSVRTSVDDRHREHVLQTTQVCTIAALLGSAGEWSGRVLARAILRAQWGAR